MAAQFNGLTNSPTQSPATSSILCPKCPINEAEEVGQPSKAIKLHVDASPTQQADDSTNVIPIGQTEKQPEINAGGVQLETAVGAVVGGKSSAFFPFAKLNERHQIPSMNLLRGQQMRSGVVNGNASSAGSSKSNPMVPLDSSSDKSPQVDEGDALSVIETTKSSTNDNNVDTFLRATPRPHGVLRAVNVIRTGTMLGGSSAALRTVSVERETPQILVEQFEQPKPPEYLVLFPLEAPLFPVYPELLGLRSMIDKQERRRHPSIIARRFKAFSRFNGRDVLADGHEVDLELRLG